MKTVDVTQLVRSIARSALAASIALSVVATAVAQESHEDSIDVLSLAKESQEVWARQDGSSLAALFTSTADAVAPTGQMARGLDEIQVGFAQVFHESMYRGSRLAITVGTVGTVRSPLPDVALVDGSWEVTGFYGDYDAIGRPAPSEFMPPYEGRFTALLVSASGSWKIEALRVMTPRQRATP